MDTYSVFKTQQQFVYPVYSVDIPIDDPIIGMLIKIIVNTRDTGDILDFKIVTNYKEFTDQILATGEIVRKTHEITIGEAGLGERWPLIEYVKEQLPRWLQLNGLIPWPTDPGIQLWSIALGISTVNPKGEPVIELFDPDYLDEYLKAPVVGIEETIQLYYGTTRAHGSKGTLYLMQNDRRFELGPIDVNSNKPHVLTRVTAQAFGLDLFKYYPFIIKGYKLSIESKKS